MKRKDIIFLLVPIFILVVAWVIFNIYHNAATSTISGTLKTNILPIAPNFDTKTVQSLKERGKIEPVFEIKKVETITPTVLPATIPTLSPTLSQPTATPSLSITP